MANITIRNLSDQTRDKLRVQAAKSGTSLEAYIRDILNRVSDENGGSAINLVDLATELFGESDGVDLQLPARKTSRSPASFDE